MSSMPVKCSRESKHTEENWIKRSSKISPRPHVCVDLSGRLTRASSRRIKARSGLGFGNRLTPFLKFESCVQPASLNKREKLPECSNESTRRKVESTCSNRDAFGSVIPTARCASRLWKCDESGQALGYVAVALNTECVLFDFKSSCS